MRPDPRGIRVPPCGGVVQPGDTREDLIARGFTPRDADEVMAFIAKLDAEKPQPVEPNVRCPVCDTPLAARWLTQDDVEPEA